MPMSMQIDVGCDGDAFADVHLHNVFRARADVDVDGEVGVEDSADVHVFVDSLRRCWWRCECRCRCR